MPSKKKKYNARFPPARIKKIMQTDEDVGKVAAAVPVIISRALELFIESLILKASETTQTRQAKTLTTAHIKQTIESEKKFDFLRDLVANITDHQAEDDLEGSNVNETKKPKVSRTRKRKEGIGRRKERKTSSDSTQAEADDDEEEDEDEDSDDDDEAERSSTQPATSQPIFITKPPSIPTNNGMQFPCPTQTLPFMPTPSFSGMFPPVQATVQEDDDYDT